MKSSGESLKGRLATSSRLSPVSAPASCCSTRMERNVCCSTALRLLLFCMSEVGHLLAQRTTNSLKHLVVASGAPLGRFEAVGVPGLCQEIWRKHGYRHRFRSPSNRRQCLCATVSAGDDEYRINLRLQSALSRQRAPERPLILRVFQPFPIGASSRYPDRYPHGPHVSQRPPSGCGRSVAI
jgi:hypothetical protein